MIYVLAGGLALAGVAFSLARLQVRLSVNALRSWFRFLGGSSGCDGRFNPSERKDKGMQTEISPYSATGYRDALARLALQRANIMHLVDLKRGGYSPRRTEMRIGRLSAYPKVLPPSLILAPRTLVKAFADDRC